jgi:hypothetical protein
MMSGDDEFESDVSTGRRAFVKRSAAASLGVGLGVRARRDRSDGKTESSVGPPDVSGVGAQEEPGLQYYNLVVPTRSIVNNDYVNKFLFTSAFRRWTQNLPFEDCFDDAEQTRENQFREGAYVYEGVLVDATDTFQLFGGDDDATQRLREVLEAQNLDFPDTIVENIGAIVGTRIYAPVSSGRLPTSEGYRAVGGETCDGEHVRLRVHELPMEITE